MILLAFVLRVSEILTRDCLDTLAVQHHIIMFGNRIKSFYSKVSTTAEEKISCYQVPLDIVDMLFSQRPVRGGTYAGASQMR